MKIKATKTITEEAELSTPCWFKKGSRYYFITDSSMIELSEGMICRWDNASYSLGVFNEKALEASTGEEISKEVFNEAFDNVMAKIIGSFSDPIPFKIPA